MSLRTIHLIFILIAIIGADLFGAWTVWEYRQTHDVWLLGFGIAVLIGGLGLIWHAHRLVINLDKANIH